MTALTQHKPTAVTDPADTRVEVQIQKMKDRFAAALPAHIPADRFVRVALNAVMKPDLAEVAQTQVGRASIFESLLKAAADGLLVDGREAALVKFSEKDGSGWANKAQYMPMIAGVLKKVRNSGEVSAVYCNAVYLNDTFKLSLVTEGVPVSHEPALGDRGEFVGVYAVARLKSGDWTQPEWMTKDQVDAVRERSRSGATMDRDGKPRRASGPWVTDYSEMARKTVLRRAAKLWPSSTDKDGREALAAAFDDDEDTQLETIELTPQPGRKQAGAAARALTADPQETTAEAGIVEAEEVAPDV